MARRVFQNPNWTPTVTGDAANLANTTFMAIQGGTTTQNIKIQEVMIEGLASSSSPTLLMLARDSIVGATPTSLAAPTSDGPLNPATAALAAPPVSFISATTSPQRSNSTSLARLNFNLNAFGGIIRWLADRDEEFWLLGNAASNGEASLSAYTGGSVGAVSAHMIYEPL